MEFPEYRARLIGFHRVFLILATNDTEQLKTCLPMFRRLMSNPYKPYWLNDISMPASFISQIKSLKNVHMNANPESLEKQAEAVKNEIIEKVKAYQGEQKALTLTRGVNGREYQRYFVTDFIYATNGEKIVEPFKYWEDCVEVYLMELSGISKSKISKGYEFKSCNSRDPRTRLRVVGEMIEEIECLKDSVLNNNFPPKILFGNFQLSMIEKKRQKSLRKPA